MRVGVVSDTHGLLRLEVLPLLAGVDYILHAGDVGDPAILQTLASIAPVTAIRGNTDTSGPCALLPATEAIELNGVLIYMVHAIEDIDIQPQAAGVRVVVYGHSHQPSVEESSGVLYLNPGSIGPRRFKLPVTLAILQINKGIVTAEIVPVLPS